MSAWGPHPPGAHGPSSPPEVAVGTSPSDPAPGDAAPGRGTPCAVAAELPHPVREVEHCWIPLPDGTRLAARLWLPAWAGPDRQVPAVLEYIPYRKRDGTVVRDSITYPYYAGHGYAGVRVDLRGSGDSEGVLRDEYLQQELDDGVAVIAWIARQPWCSGAVGMMGISWGGFNALQVAALRPPALKGIVTVCSTDDRYLDDVHYMGGCLLGDNLSWASTMFAYTACPPDPALVGDAWRAMWRERLEGSGLWLKTWLRHQVRDDYWRHGSVCEDYARIECPVLAVGGWADAYSNAIFRLLEHIEAPCKGIVGPWSHKYPHLGLPGPAIGFLQVTLGWWDRALKGIENGALEGPQLLAYMQDTAPPSTGYTERPGRWVAEPRWPSPHVERRRHPLATGRIAAPQEEVEQAPLAIHSPLTVGQFGGKWCSESAPPDLPEDQRQEDGGALVFDGAPLEERLELLGAPVVELSLAADRPVAMVAARLSDVAPDGKATRVSYGLLNLTHRDSHERPQPLEPGRRTRVQVKLNDLAQSFPPGHRVRLALSTSYWPLAWPPPRPVTLTVFTGASALELPVRPPRPADDARLPPFPPAEGAAPLRPSVIRPGHHSWRVIRDLGRDESCLEVIKDRGAVRFDAIGWVVETSATEHYFLRHDDLSTIRGEVRWERRFARGDWSVRIVTRTVLTSTEDHFRLWADLDAYEREDRRVFSKSWDETIPRHLV